MKNKNMIIVSICIAVFVCFISIFLIFFESKIMPFEFININNLWEIRVTKTPNNSCYEIPKYSGRDDFAALIKNFSAERKTDKSDIDRKKIADVRITEKQIPAIHLEIYKDGIVLGNVAYKADENSLKEIIGFIENLNAENSILMVEYPPELKVTSGGKTVNAPQGTSSWSYGNMITNSDSSHPLMWENFMDKLITDTNEAELVFPIEPKNVKVVCFSDKYMGVYPDEISDDYSYESITNEVEINGNKIILKSDSYVYEVTASFSGNGWGGTVHYGFYAEAP